MDGLIAGSAFLVVEQVQVKIHLARILRLERPHLQFKRHQRFEEAVVEKQVDEILLLTQRQAVLAAHEAETVAEFEEERLQAGDQPVFEFPLLDRTGGCRGIPGCRNS